LRLGLAFTYLYSGYHLATNPGPWVGFMPEWFQNLLPVAPELYLRLQGVGELLFAASLLSGILIRWVALLSAIEMLGILLLSGITLVTFRDIAILGVSLSLFFYYSRTHEAREEK
jgi:uncharacterized membrane protein YphA (DoxX/SURF4 family)